MEGVFLYALQLHLRRDGLRGAGRAWVAGIGDVLSHASAERLAVCGQRARQFRRLVSAAADDARWAGRSLAASPRATAAIVVSLAAVLAGNIFVTGLLDVIVYRPLPGADPHGLVRVYAQSPARPPFSELSYPEYRLLRDERTPLRGLAAHRLVRVALEAGGQDTVAWGEMVTDNYFDVLGTRLIAGSGFDRLDDATPSRPGIVLSHRFWQERLGATPRWADLSVRMNGHALAVLGVASPTFEGTEFGLAIDYWIPISLRQIVRGEATERLPAGTTAGLEVIGRLDHGLTLEEARRSLDAIVARMRTAGGSPGLLDGLRLQILPERYARLEPAAARWVPLAALGSQCLLILVLLAGTANAVTLIMARVSDQRHELGIRMAMGASPHRVVTQLLAQGLLLAMFACVIGGALAFGLARTLVATRPQGGFPIGLDLTPGASSFVYGTILAVLAGTALALPVAAFATRVPIPEALARQPRGVRWAPRNLLGTRALGVSLQVTTAVVLLFATGVALQRVARDQWADLGFSAAGVHIGSVDLSSLGYSHAEGVGLQSRLLTALRSNPRTRQAAIAQNLPLGGQFQSATVTAGTGGDARSMSAEWNRVSDGYFEALGIPVVAGRPIRSADVARAPRVAVVNRSLARALWPSEDGVGERVRISSLGIVAEVVGIVEDARVRSLLEEPVPGIYVSMAQAYSPDMAVILASSDETTAAADLREGLRAVAPSASLFVSRSMDEQVALARWAPRAAGTVATGIAAVALLLAVTGVVGSVACTLRRRQPEMAVRVALGADPASLVRLIVRANLVGVCAGLCGGLGLSLAAARLLDGAAPQLGPVGVPLVVAPLAAATGAVALAIYLPARAVLRLPVSRALGSG